MCVRVGGGRAGEREGEWEGEREKNGTQTVGFIVVHAPCDSGRLTRTSGSNESQESWNVQ